MTAQPQTRLFAPMGPLALPKAAYGLLWEPAAPEVIRQGDMALVAVDGPLENTAGGFFDSYDAILARCAAAIEDGAKHIVLRLSTPGGTVAGCFEKAAQLRAMCDDAGVTLWAYGDGQCTSAGYAWMCVAHRAAMPESAIGGSVGVVSQLMDTTQMDAQMGLRFVFVVSGEKKVLGAIGTPIDEQAVADEQALVDKLAGIFFRHVAAHHPVSVASLQALEAACLTGPEALTAGLIDAVTDLPGLLAMVAMPESPFDPDGPSETESESMDEMTPIEMRLASMINEAGGEVESTDDVLAWLDLHGEALQEAIAALLSAADEGEAPPEEESEASASAPVGEQIAALTKMVEGLAAKVATAPKAGGLSAKALAGMEAMQAATEQAEAEADKRRAAEAAVDTYLASGRRFASDMSRDALVAFAEESPERFAAMAAKAPQVAPVGRQAADPVAPTVTTEEEAEAAISAMDPHTRSLVRAFHKANGGRLTKAQALTEYRKRLGAPALH